MSPTMHIELVKMSQFFAMPISNDDKKLVGLNKQVKTEIGLRILEEYGLAELVKKRPFDPFWRPTKKLNRDLKTAELLPRQRNLKAAAALLSSLAVSKCQVPAQVTFSGRQPADRSDPHECYSASGDWSLSGPVWSILECRRNTNFHCEQQITSSKRVRAE
jgi:hypothetical protein